MSALHRRRIVIPSLPDRVMRRLFELLDYRQLCGVEGVCKRWQQLVRFTLRRRFRELVIEQVSA